MKLKWMVAFVLVVSNSAIAQTQSIHPTTKEGAGAKPDSAESQRERIPEPPNAHRPEAQGGANSQQNLEYGKATQPDGKQLHEGQPPKP